MVLALPIFHKENRRFSSRLSTFILYLSFLDPHMLKQLTECSLKDVMKTGFGNFWCIESSCSGVLLLLLCSFINMQGFAQGTVWLAVLTEVLYQHPYCSWTTSLLQVPMFTQFETSFITSSLVKEAHQHLLFLWTLKYTEDTVSTIKSILSNCITVCYGNWSVLDYKTPFIQKICAGIWSLSPWPLAPQRRALAE